MPLAPLAPTISPCSLYSAGLLVLSPYLVLGLSESASISHWMKVLSYKWGNPHFCHRAWPVHTMYTLGTGVLAGTILVDVLKFPFHQASTQL